MSDVIAALGWRDLVDILIVSVVVYRVIVMFRGTRTAQMLVGLTVLVTASLLARRAELHTAQWILDQFWAFWAIALVVIFQPELRRALARVGQGAFLRNFWIAREAERVRVVEALSQAVDRLGAQQVGALIVIERTGALRMYEELGVPLDAIITADLLESVFLPASPLHDGAVLVRGSRAVAAGCFLPLSRSAHLGRQLGTRHRAALGITEESDAVAITLSEETGRISVAVDGQIEPMTDAEALRARLHELLRGARPITVPLAVRLGVRT
jgi:diadenylate cyclase